VLGFLFVYLHWNFLLRMYRISTGEWGGDWSHALIIPLISIYFISQNRDRLIATTRRVYWPGLMILFAGMFAFMWCIYPVRNDMLQGYSMIVSLFGLVLFLLGPAAMRVLWFPILYLALGVKVADRLWDQIAWKLQLVAANSSALVMRCLQIDAAVKGSTIELAFVRSGQWVVEKLNVAEACAGLRMLMAFIALGAAMAYLVERAWWKRIIMVLLAVPIAVLVNIGRVTVIGLLTTVNKEMATGDFHLFVGMLMLIPAAGLFMLVGWILDHVVIEEATEKNRQAVETIRIETQAGGDRVGLGQSPWVFQGLALGFGLTAITGFGYGLLLAINRPEDLFGGRLSGKAALWLFLGVCGLLMMGLGMVRKLTQSGEGIQSVYSNAISRGLATGVLVAAVLGLNGVVKATRTVLIKQEIPIRIPLFQLPDQVGSWIKVSEGARLRPEEVEALGTKQYLSRSYRDTSLSSSAPEAHVRLHVAYYTGTPDTVPHVPDRCLVAGGMQRVGSGITTIELSPVGLQKEGEGWRSASKLDREGVRLPKKKFDATIFTFAHPDRPTQSSNAVYFFVANGKFLPTPEWVRVKAFDPRDRYSYYCKVEVGLYGVEDPGVASRRAASFLSAMLPEIMACLPDWEEVQSGRWPAP